MIETSTKLKTSTHLPETIKNFNVVGLGLRSASIFGKFLLITYLAKVFSLAELGIYGLFVTSILLITYVIGFEFHTYTTRQILGTSTLSRPAIILNQGVMHLIAYVFVLPLALLIFAGGFLPWKTAVYFFIVAILVHIGQEMYRLLITLSRPRAAYLVSFLVHGLWAYLVVFITLWSPELQTMEVIFVSWAGSALIGVVVGGLLLAQMKLFRFQGVSVDFNWIRKGLTVGSKFFIGIMAFRIIDLSDRYFLQHFSGEADVGVYTLFGSVANIAQEFVFAGFVAVIFPKMIASLQSGNREKYRAQQLQLKRSVIRGSVVMGVLLSIGIYILIFLLQREELLDNIPAFFLLLGSSLVLNLSMIPHYHLYAYGQDKLIMWSVLVGVVINLILNSLFIPVFGIMGAAVATIISFSIVGTIKWWFAHHYIKGEGI